MERVLARAVGLFGLVFAAQAIPSVLQEVAMHGVARELALVVLVYVAILAFAIATAVVGWVRPMALVVAISFAVALLMWHPLHVGAPMHANYTPWIYYLCTVATGAAAIALPTRWALVYTVVVPTGYGFIRADPEGGGATILLASFDAAYSIILGCVALAIITMLTQAATEVDEAQAAALERYRLAARLHATQTARVRVDAFVHDNVIASLLTAANATGARQRTLAASMASAALERLDGSGLALGPDPQFAPLSDLVSRIRATVSTIGADIKVHAPKRADLELPSDVIHALHAATAQAIVNTVQHAGDRVTRTVVVSVLDEGGCRVQVGDDGVGFDLSTVPAGRLGVRASIVEQVENVGGSAVITSAPGAGTVVTLRWPRKMSG
ncbi:MAG TPA: ATP-binding protein [Candidatus Lumbricidophila sp.]|nr:ATP-binding protein [Candidatus Lumbricidophila sp.]